MASRSPRWADVRSWWRNRGAAGATQADAEEDEAPHQPRHLVDAHTRTFWSKGASATTTLVETDSPVALGNRSRMAALLDGHARGAAAAHSGRPRSNPAFSEGVFVELMRAHRYERAFDLLAPDCQSQWGSVDRFSEAQRGGAMRHLQSARVTSVEHLDNWIDPVTAIAYGHVAALEVEYTLDNGRRHLTVPRTVHLVAVDGQWRSLCYPEAVGAALPAR